MLKKDSMQGGNPAKRGGQGRRTNASKSGKAAAKYRTGADGKSEPVIDYMDHAPVHQVYVTDGLFRPIQHGKRATAIRVTGQYHPVGEPRQRVQCVWASEQALDITDQLVLFHLCQLGAAPGEHRQVLGPKRPEYGDALQRLKWVNQDDATDPTMVDPNGWGQFDSQMVKPNLVVLFTTAQAIARGIGLTATGSNTNAVRESLRRMIRTTCQVTRIDGIQGSKTVSQYSVLGGSRNGEALTIILNPELTERCLSHQGVAWVNMTEQRALESKPARRLHAWLTAWALTAEVRTIKLETLLSHVWGTEPCTASAKKSRIRTLKDAVQAIARLPGWVCWLNEKDGMVRVRKPRFVGSPKPGVEMPANFTVVTPTSSVLTTTDTAVTQTIAVVTESGVPCKANADAGFREKEALI